MSGSARTGRTLLSWQGKVERAHAKPVPRHQTASQQKVLDLGSHLACVRQAACAADAYRTYALRACWYHAVLLLSQEVLGCLILSCCRAPRPPMHEGRPGRGFDTTPSCYMCHTFLQVESEASGMRPPK